ncbi:carbohydrate ABC transporter permease [Cohnella thailandensis]|jgi:ABC-type sugar transport system, permease component|uniref:Carbohydrate ABC transporter permease n=1 Tax=Cohnella thailandensis TaxID=557557 RepID=A0A841T0B9_9BACL|nr:carbohydrate ABC transporter permease [Cohnella thailandensis]MBB6634491.1 carbohydrate ABC transporter permease [Cohnella thailandensis]MBP1972955.1 multiple sugar transport system permease protein [Cohnella thailandensis]
MSASTKRLFSQTGKYALLTVVLALFAGPLAWMLSTMLKTKAETYKAPPSLLPESLNFESFNRLFEVQPLMWRWIGNSFIISILVVIGVILSSSIVAYGFSRFSNKYKNRLFPIVLMTMMIPPSVMMIPSYVLFTKLHWVDTWLPLIVPAWLGGAYYIFLFRQFFMSIPHELDEATYLDGGNRWTVFSRVILPLSKPIVMTTVIFAFVNTWLDFLGPFLYIKNNEMFTLSVGLQLLIGQTSQDFPALAAGAFISIVPIGLLFLFAQRYIVEGVMLTGSKG